MRDESDAQEILTDAWYQLSTPDEYWPLQQDGHLVFDAHIHAPMNLELFHRNLNLRYHVSRLLAWDPLNTLSSFPRLHDGNYSAILSVLYVPERDLLTDIPIVNLIRFVSPGVWRKVFVPTYFDATMTMLHDMESAVGHSKAPAEMRMARSLVDLDRILAMTEENRPIAVIHTIEGAHSLFGKDTSDDGVLKNLKDFYDLGVMYITIAHLYANPIANGALGHPEDISVLSPRRDVWRDPTRGLTKLGQKVVERMMELGMFVDLAHSTPTVRQQVYDIADSFKKPILVSHVGAHQLNPAPYNLEDWEIRRIADLGGFIGVIFMPYWLQPMGAGEGIDYVSKTIRHMVKIGGMDVVGVGSDFDGFSTPPTDMASASEVPRLTKQLQVEGFNPIAIRKILRENLLRVIREGWGRKC